MTWYCQNINCGEKVNHPVTAGGSATCGKCGGTWVGNEPPKPLRVVADGTQGMTRGLA